MKITATLPVEAEISENEVIKITITKLCKKYNLHPELYIKNGNLTKDYEIGGGGHSWTEEKTIRVASDIDIYILTTINDLLEDYTGWFRSEGISVPKAIYIADSN